MSIENTVECLECGCKMKRISNTHLEKKHSGMTLAVYKAKYPGCKIDAEGLAYQRVAHFRDKTYEEIYGSDKGQRMKDKRKEATSKDWNVSAKRQKMKNPANVPFRKLALKHYGCTCQMCGITDKEKKLNVHHIDGNRLHNVIDNLIVVCTSCHGKLHRGSTKEKRKIMGLRGVAHGFEKILQALKVNTMDENFMGTPNRLARTYVEIFEGLMPEAQDEIQNHLSTTFPCSYDEMIIIKDIHCWSMCPHHFLPVEYVIHIGYIPNGKVLGASKLPRLAILLAKRPVLQEQLTKDIVDHLQKVANPKGVMVIISGKHLCMRMRGIKTDEASMVTSSVHGSFRDNLASREEFLNLVSKKS